MTLGAVLSNKPRKINRKNIEWMLEKAYNDVVS